MSYNLVWKHGKYYLDLSEEFLDKITDDKEIKNHVIQKIFPSHRYLLPHGREYHNVETMLKLLHINVGIEDENSRVENATHII